MFNQGNFFYYSDEEIIRGIKAAVVAARSNEIQKRKKMIDKFSYSASIDQILDRIF